MKVNVPEWVREFGVISLNLTPTVFSDSSFVRCPNPGSDLCAQKDRIQGKSEELVLNDFVSPVKLGIPAGKESMIGFSLAIQYIGQKSPQRSPMVLQGAFTSPNVKFKVYCSPEGNIKLIKPERGRTPPSYFPDRSLSMDLEVYPGIGKPDPADAPMPGIPTSVWNEWMKQISVVRLTIFAAFTMSVDGPGSTSVTVYDGSVSIPSPETTNKTALVGPMTIELEPVDAIPTITAPQGFLYDVYFDVGSFELDKIVSAAGDTKHQGNALDAWIRENVGTHWDVMQVLIREKLAIVEARASSTSKGLSVREHFILNQELSRKRLDAVVKRLKKTLAEQNRDIVKLDEKEMKGNRRVVGATWCGGHNRAPL